MRRGPAALALAVVDIVGYGILAIAASADPGSDPASTLMFGGAVAVFSLMGALLIRRVPANPIGALLLGVGSAQTAGIALLVYGGTGGSAVPPWPGSAIVSALGDVWYSQEYMCQFMSGEDSVFSDDEIARAFESGITPAYDKPADAILPLFGGG